MKEDIQYAIEKEIGKGKETVKGEFSKKLNSCCIMTVGCILLSVLSILILIAYFKKIEGIYNIFAMLICAVALVAIFVCITIIFVCLKKYECKTREKLEQSDATDWLILKAYENLLLNKNDNAKEKSSKKRKE